MVQTGIHDDVVNAIREGKLFYNPELMDRIATLSSRLANLDEYVARAERLKQQLEDDKKVVEERHMTDEQRKVELGSIEALLPSDGFAIDGRTTEALRGDLSELLLLQAKFTSNLVWLREYHDRDMHKLAVKHRKHRGECAQLGDAGFHLARVELPHSLIKVRRQLVYGGLFELALEVVNQGSDIALTVLVLAPGKSEVFFKDLYYTSVAALVTSYLLRLVIGLLDRNQVDWADSRRWRRYFYGVARGLVDPNGGYEIIKSSFKQLEDLNPNVLGDSGSSFRKDVIATQARSDFKAARMSAFSALALLVQDLPQLAVEVILIMRTRDGEFTAVFFIALATTVLHLARLLVEAASLLNDVPALRNLTSVRQLVFRGDNDVGPETDEEKPEDEEDAGGEDEEEDEEDEADEEGGPHRVPRPTAFVPGAPNKTQQKKKKKKKKRKKKETAQTVDETVRAFFKAVIQEQEPMKQRATAAHRLFSGITGLLGPTKTLGRGAVTTAEPPTAGPPPAAAPPAAAPPAAASPAARQSYWGRVRAKLWGWAWWLDWRGYKRSRNVFRLFQKLLVPKLVQVKHTPSVVSPASALSRLWRLAPTPLPFDRMHWRTICLSIRSIELTACTSVTDDLLRVVADRCPNLRSINLSFCSNVTDRGLRYLCRCPSLESVMLDGCSNPRLSDQGVYWLARWCMHNLREISLRNIRVRDPRLDPPGYHAEDNGAGGGPPLSVSGMDLDRVLQKLAQHCRRLRVLKVDRDPTNASEVDLTKGIDDLTLKIAHALRVVRLSYAGSVRDRGRGDRDRGVRDRGVRDKGVLNGLVSALNPFAVEVALSGFTLFDDKTLTDGFGDGKLTLLRFLRLSSTSVTDAGVSEVVSHCPQLRIVLLNDVKEVTFDSMDKLWNLRNIRNVASNGMRPRVDFYLGLFERQCNRLETCCPATGPGQVPDDLQRTIEKIRNHVDGFKAAGGRLHAGALEQIVELADFVRRAVFRALRYDKKSGKFLTRRKKETLPWREGPADMERARRTARRLEEHDDDRPRPPTFPLPALKSFAVLNTSHLNLQVDFDKQSYVLILPESSRDGAEPDDLKGRLTKMVEITLEREKKVSRFRSIPKSAHYFCFAYPLPYYRRMPFREVSGDPKSGGSDATRRFGAFGGFLYFTKKKEFVTALALTDGAALSFNGPFEVKRSDKIWNDGWEDVTIPALVPSDVLEAGDRVEFRWVNPAKGHTPWQLGKEGLADLAKRHNVHGGFAYRTLDATGKLLQCHFYPLSPPEYNIIIPDKPTKDPGHV